MHFEKVPRLGCYMAVPLIYNSCLFNEALEEAVEDYQTVLKEKEEQDKLKAEHEQAQQDKKQQAADAGEEFEYEEYDG